MKENGKEKNKKYEEQEPRGLFVMLTKQKAYDKIEELEKKYERELTNAEKKSVIGKVARNTKRKVKRIIRRNYLKGLIMGAVATVGAFGIHKVTSLPEGAQRTEMSEDQDKYKETEKETTSKNKAKEFRKGLSMDDAIAKSYENPKVQEIINETMKPLKMKAKVYSEVNNIKSVDEALAYLKKLYVEEYDKNPTEYGKSIDGAKISASDIAIRKCIQNYVYIRDDGVVVTHGSQSGEIMQKIGFTGTESEYKDNVNVYQVSIDDENKIIDAGIVMNGKMERVIAGDEYDNMQDNKSVLETLGPITTDIYDLMFEFNELEKTPDNEFIANQIKAVKENLVNNIANYKLEQTIDQNEQEGMELGD